MAGPPDRATAGRWGNDRRRAARTLAAWSPVPHVPADALSERNAQDALRRGAAWRRLVHVSGRRRVSHRSISLPRAKRRVGVAGGHGGAFRPGVAAGPMAPRVSGTVLGKGNP